MACTKHFLNMEWEHHNWRRRVSSAENRPNHETNMWGRVVDGQYTLCHKEYICDTCGKTRDNIQCMCDVEVGERCPIRCEWVERSHQAHT